MISLDDYLWAVQHVLGRHLNPPQETCVRHPLSSLMIVAGPGSGKTTVLVLRAMRHIFVDGCMPEHVLITTFTRKAAAELRSRLIGWGLELIEHFKGEADRSGDATRLAWLQDLDINSCRTGTLDSFCQQWLGAVRPVGTPNPIMLEEFAAEFIYRRKVFAPLYRASKDAVGAYYAQYTFLGIPPKNEAEAAGISITINNRLIQDLVDEKAFATAVGEHAEARKIQVDMLGKYRQHLRGQQLYDFSLCAEEILQKLRNGSAYPNPAIPEIKALLIDEYQDTNPLQEAIYFELAKRSAAPVTIVGDDDQALYRFRGATVELFTNFQARFKAEVGGASHVEHLVKNHRSTPQIISFVNKFVSHDFEFSPARVAGKPEIVAHNSDVGVPVLGLFRPTMADLSKDLAILLEDIFKNGGRRLPNGGPVVVANEKGGALGDAVFLSSSVREYKDRGDERLPASLRRELERRGMGVFNPRGQALKDIPEVRILLGLVLECIDANGDMDVDMPITRPAKDCFAVWRLAAKDFIATNPAPHTTRDSLATFVQSWKHHPTGRGKWPPEWPLLDLFYTLIVWMPKFQNDPEHQIYLEAVLRCVAQGANYSPYSLALLNEAPHDLRSRQSVIRDLLEPIAVGAVDVDEDLLFSIPRHRLSIMTIHQSKGLEFPLVIVDVGSEFKTNHHTQRFRRFPGKPSSTVDMESHMADHTPVGKFRTARTSLDRTFDDLVRLYYVAYSRPETVLLLVGLNTSIEYSTKIQNIATCWARGGDWSWRKNPPMARGTPAFPDLHPLVLI